MEVIVALVEGLQLVTSAVKPNPPGSRADTSAPVARAPSTNGCFYRLAPGALAADLASERKHYGQDESDG